MARPPTKPPKLPRLVDVHVRLFAEDVEKLQRAMLEAGDREWQPRLRKLVHDALRTKGVIK